jgi:hypothetical protein
MKTLGATFINRSSRECLILRQSAIPGWAVTLPMAACIGLAGCGATRPVVPVPAPVPTVAPTAATVALAPAREAAAWVEWGASPIARAVATPGGCPTIAIDGQAAPMSLRVAAGTPAERPTANGAGPAKAAVFDIDVCEAALPALARDVRVDGRALPAPRPQPRRIVVLGDTGCRIKGEATQACGDPAAWPFAQVAATAAALRPDLVIHVGDYHYRETPCPVGNAGCAGSPWGYGWDAWNADFFVPARPLLAAAPWIFVRGNHEECARAGQGWFRLLAPEPYAPARSCDLPANDVDADHSAPYAVPLGKTTQVIVFDSAHAGNAALDLSRPRDRAIHRAYVANARALDGLALPGVRSWFASHHPVLGFAPDDRPGATHPHPGNAPLQQALEEVNGGVYFPPAIQAALHGHVHLFQALGFADGHPATLVAGHGGDYLDTPLPAALPAGFAPAPGTRLAHATTSDAFGFLVLERAGADEDDGRWTVIAYRRDGSEMTRCALGPTGALTCDHEGPVR